MIVAAIILIVVAVSVLILVKDGLAQLRDIASTTRFLATTAANAQNDGDQIIRATQHLNDDVVKFREMAIASVPRPFTKVDESRGRLPVRVHALEAAGRNIERITVDGQEVKNAFYADEFQGCVDFWTSDPRTAPAPARSTIYGFVEVKFKEVETIRADA